MPIRRALRVPLTLTLLVSLFCSAGTQYFVSPEGNDAWTGLKPEKGFFGSGGPFRSLARAQRALRELSDGGLLSGDVRILLAEGEYALPRGFSHRTGELGGAHASVSYVGAAGARVVFRGDMPLANWRREPAGPYRAKLPGGASLALFARGGALHEARYPNVDPSHPRSGGFCYVNQAETAAGTLFLRLTGAQGLSSDSWSELTSATLHVWPDHGPRERLQITAAKAASSTICLAQHGGVVPGTRLFFEGLPDELDSPGEWLAVPERRLVRVVPPEDCEPWTDITAATTSCLLRIAGRGKVRFEGIEFRGSAGDLVQIEETQCVFERCAFDLCEGSAVSVADSTGVRIEGCDFRHVGGTAVRLVRSPRAVVRNCWISETGTRQPTEAAIVLADADCCQATISRNLIHDVPGSGILLRGTGHRCERNLLHNLGQEDSQGAGIVVTDGNAEAPNLVGGNVVMDSGGYQRQSDKAYAFPAGMAGIAVLGGSGTKVVENLLVRSSLAGIHASGQAHAIENNLLVGGGEAHIAVGAATELTVRRNVVLNQSERTAWITGERFAGRLRECDWNMVWGYADDPIIRTPGGPLTWDEWQTRGFDRRTILADPLCRAPELDEYELLPRSLALKLGFVPLAPDEAGCFADHARRTWPIDDDVWREQHLKAIPHVHPGGNPRKSSGQ